MHWDTVSFIYNMLNRSFTLVLVLLPVGYTLVGAAAAQNPFDYRSHLQPPTKETLARGADIYANLCVNCHGQDGATPSLAIATPFAKGPYKFGADPVSLMKTISFGNGLMGPQSWMTEAERFSVIHYIRETFQKGTPHWSAIDFDALPKTVARSKEALPSTVRDFGPALASQYKREFESALTIRLDAQWSMAVDLHSMDRIAVWRGGFLDLSQTQHLRGRGAGVPSPDGELLDALGVWQWAHDNRFDYPTDELLPRGPMPSRWMHYLGQTVFGSRLILHYRINGRQIAELPTRASSLNGLSTTLRVHPGSTPLKLKLARSAAPGPRFSDEGVFIVSREKGEGGDEFASFSVMQITGDLSLTSLWSRAEEDVVITIPPSDDVLTFTVHQCLGEGKPVYDSFVGYTKYWERHGEPDLGAMTKAAGPLNWPDRIETLIEYGPDDQAYTLDTIRLPKDNPWHAWMRTSALAFFPDGRMVVSTHGGDIWLVSGLDGDTAVWKRFAAGLYEPFGLQVVDDQVVVTCRDRLVRLHDINRDGEADFYESFSADDDVSVWFHAFNFDLQRDREGNFYYAKSGQYTDYRLPGSVIKVSPDGKHRSVHCTGFRTPNGMGMLPDGRVTVSDNQGNWMPASKISLCEPGGFYGYVQTHSAGPKKWQPDGGRIDPKKVVPPERFDPPLIWMPQDVDNSSGGQLWVDDKRWGPLAGKLIHTSFGKGWMYYLMLQEIDGVTQAAMTRLPLNFETGIHRARVNPADGQVYATGLNGWNGGGRKNLADGGIQRVRYTGAPALLLLHTQVIKAGIELTFNFEIDAASARADQALELTQWNYKWLPRYGSDRWSARAPDKKGRDTIIPIEVRVDRNRLVLTVPDLKPVHQLNIRMNLKSRNGKLFQDQVLMTVHGLPED